MGFTVDELRRRHPQFTYRSYSYQPQGDDLVISFDFHLDPDIDFRPQVVIKGAAHLKPVDSLVFHLGLIEMLSYWKATCSPRIHVAAGPLSQLQLDWWKNLLLKGMGEFFYVNQIDFTPRDFVAITADQLVPTIPIATPTQDKYLNLVGGGKDSAVALEILKTARVNHQSLLLNPTLAALAIAKGTSPIIIKRTLDPKLLQLNQQGYLNGHTPFSAYLAFLSLLTGSLFGFKHVVVANERSSDEENISYLGYKINHQYSKSLEFERSFRDYTAQYLTSSISYFSLLRPLWEIQICKTFSNYPQYFSVFKSCNVNQKQNSWCGRCPKCVSTFILLYQFMPKDTISIFGSNLLENPEVTDLIQHLSGEKQPKPFECVGTKREIKAALNHNFSDLLADWGHDEFIPTNLKLILSLFIRQICILGYGREGESTEKFLKQLIPNISIAIADQKSDKDYLNKLKDSDVIFRSPGIPLSLVREHARPDALITSQTKLFFQLARGTVIGITGTKGKSTTASLIYHVLKSHLTDVRLVGNIGTPALPALDSATKDTIFVFELSSHQLLDLDHSPHMAVLLNLFPEHLDYYTNLDEYITAKSNITRHQTPKDILIYNADDPIVSQIAKSSLAQKHAFEMIADSAFPAANVIYIIGKLFGLSQSQVNQQLQTFSPLPHRLENIGTFRGITFINDSLATIPQAAIHALKVLGPQVSTLIAGGFDRGVDYSPLSQAIPKTDLNTLILLPTTGDKIKQGLKPKPNLRIFSVNSLADAVKLAFQHTPEGKVCLMSPASASFNMFRDYEQRGNEFKRLVASLA